MPEALRKTLHTITTLENFDAPLNSIRSTCRKGRKWADVEIGEEIDLTIGESDADRNPYGRAVVLRVDYLRFCDIGRFPHVITNHSIRSRVNTERLLEAMRRAYGESFSVLTPVTVLFYKRIA